ncbi:hypothetical protein BASA60_003861 [Batrachochytrium salamandrivorans]|nr:hypothetical protein BASA60_003861 [Batrachochytrium salamandrivorans]
MGNPKLVDLFVNYFGIQDWQSMVLRRNRGPTANNGVDYQSLQRRQNIDWAITCLHEGTIALHKGDNSTAMKKYNAALDMDPQCVDALVARGGIFLNSGKFTSAMKDLEYALSLDPHHENAIRYLRRVRTAMSKEESDKKALLRGEFLMPANYDPRNKDVPTLKTKPEIEDKYPMLNDSESSGREGPSRPHRRRSLSDSERQSKTRRKHKHQKKKSKSSSKHSKKKSKHSKRVAGTLRIRPRNDLGLRLVMAAVRLEVLTVAVIQKVAVTEAQSPVTRREPCINDHSATRSK